MPMPIWYVERAHEHGRRVTPRTVEQLVRCVGLNAIGAAARGREYVVPPKVLEALCAVDS